MEEIQNHNCPLCQRPAKFRFADYDNRKHFICDHCTEFHISVRAERVLADSIPDWRSQFSEKARQAKDDQVLVISLPSAPKQPGVANPALIGEFVLRKDLPN
ncbi:MAG: hypothetical protein HY661_07430 [Betaproteobacteria bacterium]|nr:hypothetical protein [Betaproteobacteria bacterium]